MAVDSRAEYDNVAEEIVSVSPSTRSQMFGMPCLKNDIGKAFAGYYNGAMVFKLPSPEREEALALPGAVLFDPSGLGRPMKEWVQVPAVHAPLWLGLAREALNYSVKAG